MEKKILDVGCGKRKVPGAIGIDRALLSGVDVVWDLEKLPYPFESSSFDEVHLNHIIEHFVDTITMMEEIWRLTKPGGKVFIRVPHYSGRKAWFDPTHRKAFCAYSFDYFGENDFEYYSHARFKVKQRRLKWFMSYPNLEWYEKNIRPVDLPFWFRPIVRVVQALIDFVGVEVTERFLCYYLGGIDEICLELEAVK